MCTSTPRSRELKSPRAFCSPGARARRDLPRGHAQGRPGRLPGPAPRRPGTPSTSLTPGPTSPFEYRYLGDNAVTEGFAFILDHLVLNAPLARGLPGASPTRDEFLKFAYLVDLYFMRRYAGKLAYETELHVQEGPLGHMAERYNALAQRGRPGRRARRQLPDRRRRRLLRGALPARLDARGRLPHAAAGPLRHGVVPRARGGGAGSSSCGRTGSRSRPTSCCSRTAAGGSTPIPCACTSSACSGAEVSSRPGRPGPRPGAAAPAAPPARPVELGEVDALPGAQLQPAFVHRHHAAAAHQARLHVRVGVALEVGERQVRRHQAPQGHDQVARAPRGRRSR